MRKLWMLVLVVPVLLGLVMSRDGFGRAQTFPTPVGQLGGPVPLTPEESQPTSTPLPTPTEATPAGGSAACNVAPIALDDAMARLAGSARNDGNAPKSDASKPANTVESTFSTFIACLNSGDFLRVAAVTTPEFFTVIVAGTGWPADQLPAKLSALHPRDPDLFLHVVSIGPAVDQTGGEIALTVSLLDPASPFLGETEYGARFVQDSGKWLLAGLEAVR